MREPKCQQRIKAVESTHPRLHFELCFELVFVNCDAKSEGITKASFSNDVT